MTGEGEHREGRDSPEDRGGQLEEYRAEIRERHPELEGDGKEGQQGQREQQGDGRREENSPESGEKADGAEERSPGKDEETGERSHERDEDRSEKPSSESDGGEERDTNPVRAEKAEAEDEEPPANGDEPKDAEQREPESDEGHVENYEKAEQPGEGEATERANPEPQPDEKHGENHEPEQPKVDEATDGASPEPEGPDAGIEHDELERFRDDIEGKYPEEEKPIDERPEQAESEKVEADSPSRQDDPEERLKVPRDTVEAEPGHDGGERPSDGEDRAIQAAEQPEPAVEPPENHGEEEQRRAEREEEQPQDSTRQEKGPDPNLDGLYEKDGQTEGGDADQDSRPKPIEAGENSDSEISRRENEHAEPRADEANPGSRAKEQGIQQTLESGNAESADKEPKVEDGRGVNERLADIEMMRQPHGIENDGKGPVVEPSDRGAAENIQERLDAEKMEPKAADSGSQRESVPSVLEEKRQDIEISSGVDEKPVSVRYEQLERADSTQYIASFEATAIRRPEDGRTAFEISVESLERQTTVTFEKGRVYVVSGSIENVYDFRKLYSAGESEKMAVFAPSRLADSIEKGERYAINVRSVQEISRTDKHLGVFYEGAQERDGKSGGVKFDLQLTSFEKRTGVQFEEGKTYKITGTIGDITDFELTRSRNEGKYLYVTPPREAAEMIEPGRKYELKVISVEERRTYTVQPTQGEVRLQLQKHALESVGIDLEGMKGRKEQDRIVEFTIRNLSHEGEAEKRLYSQVNPTEGAILKLGRTGVKQGDTIELVRARFYDSKDFLKDYDAHRGKETQNVALQLEGRKLAMEVDGRKFEFSEHRLDVHALRVFMKAKTEAFKYDLHFIYDATEGTIIPKTVKGRFIESFSSSQQGLEVKYAPRDKDVAALPEPRLLPEVKWEMPQYLEKVKLLGENLRIESPHWFEADEALHRYILDTRNADEYSKRGELGTIGENLGTAILTKLGWTEVERHPFDSRRGPGPEWYKHGTDILFREPVTDQLYLFEFRNWQNSRVAMDKTADEVMSRRNREKTHRTLGKISGAYIAIVDLDKRSTIGELRVKRVW